MLGPGNQYRTKDSSAIAFFLSDLEPSKRIKRISQLEKHHRHPNYLATLPMVPSFLIGEGHFATFLKHVSTDFLSNVQPMPVVEPVQAWAYKNTALLAQSFVFSATSHDLATCLMEGYDGRKVSDLLRIPDRYAIPLAVAVGYDFDDNHPGDTNTNVETPRLPVSEMVFSDVFGEPWGHDDDAPHVPLDHDI
jgi:nitroreductase